MPNGALRLIRAVRTPAYTPAEIFGRETSGPSCASVGTAQKQQGAWSSRAHWGSRPFQLFCLALAGLSMAIMPKGPVLDHSLRLGDPSEVQLFYWNPQHTRNGYSRIDRRHRFPTLVCSPRPGCNACSFRTRTDRVLLPKFHSQFPPIHAHEIVHPPHWANFTSSRMLY